MNSYRADIEARRDDRRRKWRTGAIAVVMVLLLTGLAGAGVVWRTLFHDMPALPPVAELWNLKREPAIEIRAADGMLIGHRGPHYARSVPLEEMPDHLVLAFLAAEDHRFYDHGGADLQALVRSAWVNWRQGETVQGGSTITQQLIKNTLLSPEQTIRRKAQEIRLALALERRMSKDDILSLYLNRVYLGERAYGVEAASQRYFDKSARDVSLAEAALLAGLPKAPSRLSPAENRAAAAERGESVLNRMAAYGFISPETRQAAVAVTPQIAEAIPEDPQADWGYAIDLIEARARKLAGGQAHDLVVHTTLQPETQKQAEDALRAVLDQSGVASGAGQGAVFAMDYGGAVRAMVGGRSYSNSQFNRAVQARRQPGSAFKPFVYAAAFEAGLSPVSVRRDQPLRLEGGWTPENYGGSYRGSVTLREAFKRSINTVAVQLGEQVGPETVADLAKRLGIDSPLRPLPSLALGSSEVTLAELTAAYSVFARDGQFIEPYMIESVTNTRGRSLYQHALKPRRALNQEIAREMTAMMQEVVASGTGTRAQLGGRPAAGKTGTSQQSRDAWFVGYTAQLVAGVWIGNDDDSPMRGVTGGALPAEVWRRFMTATHEGLEEKPLNAPPPRDLTPVEARKAAFYAELMNSFQQEAAPEEG